MDSTGIAELCYGTDCTICRKYRYSSSILHPRERRTGDGDAFVQVFSPTGYVLYGVNQVMF